MKKISLVFVTMLFVVLFAFAAFAGQWKSDAKGWWWDNGNGTYPANQWQWCDGDGDGVAQCFYFDGNGYALINTITPDGYTVNEDGAWVKDGVVQVLLTDSNQSVKENKNARVDGIYYIYSMGTIFAAETMRMDSSAGYLQLNSDGSGWMYAVGEGAPIRWRQDGSTVIINDGTMDMYGKYTDGVIVTNTLGMIIYWAKNGADVSWINATSAY